ncbi:hypothetical protein [Streptomyces noursei]
MPKETVFWCDECMKHGKRVPARTADYVHVITDMHTGEQSELTGTHYGCDDHLTPFAHIASAHQDHGIPLDADARTKILRTVNGTADKTPKATQKTAGAEEGPRFGCPLSPCVDTGRGQDLAKLSLTNHAKRYHHTDKHQIQWIRR